jgi:iron complex outermembrane receptor protein
MEEQFVDSFSQPGVVGAICRITAIAVLAAAFTVSAQDPEPAAASADSSTPVAEPADAAPAGISPVEAVAESAAPTPEPLPTIPVPEPPPEKVERVRDRDEPVKIDDIVVTAQKIKERPQDVPVAMTILNEEQLDRQKITQFTDLSRAVPSIEVFGQPGNADTRISIRGISTESFSVTAEQAVSLVVDGVVLGKAPAVSLFDVGRVEVLRGPQGTLFGKNSSAGVISVVTNAPDTSRFAAGGHVDFGSEFGYRLMQGTMNIPLFDNMALRINAGQSLTKGFVHNNPRNEDSEQQIDGFRARLLWDILPDLTFNLIADYEQQYTSEQIYLLFRKFDDAATGQPKPLPDCGGAYASDENRVSCNGDPTFNDGKSWGFSGQFEWNLGDHALTSISAYRRYTQYNEIDVDGLTGNYYNNANEFNNSVLSQELRIASRTTGRFRYVAGGYYSDSHVPNFLTQVIGGDMLLALGTGTVPISLCTMLGICVNDLFGLNQPNRYTADIKSMALFGQATYQLFDPLKLIGGLRYTRDDVRMVSVNYVGVALGLPVLQDLSPLIPLNEPLLGASKVDNLSWKAGLQYDFSRHLMSYFTASRGYKGPQVVFNPPNLIPGLDIPNVTLPTPASISIVRPEYPMAYELGLKSTLFGGLLAANLNLFHTKIKDFQSSSFNGQGDFTPNNIPSVVTKGAELDLFGYLGPGLQINGGLLYNKVTYPHPYFVNCTQVGPECPDTEAGTLQDIGGKQLIIAPRWKVTLAPEYSFGLPFATTGFVSVDAVYRSAMHFTASDDTRTEVSGRTVFGARIGVRDSMDSWEVSVFARNLTDRRNPAYVFAPYLLGSATAPGTDTSGHALYTESLRFIGVSVGARF